MATPVEGRPGRLRVSSGSAFEPIAGYSRAVRIGERVLVSGTTATNGTDEVVCPGDPAGQTTFILDKIAASLAALGADSTTSCARASISPTQITGSQSPVRTAGALAQSVRPIRCSRSAG